MGVSMGKTSCPSGPQGQAKREDEAADVVRDTNEQAQPRNLIECVIFKEGMVRKKTKEKQSDAAASVRLRSSLTTSPLPYIKVKCADQSIANSFYSEFHFF
jgi:hypothetical protein